MIEQGHDPNVASINVKLPRRGSSLGIASMVLGILALLICWIPFLNLLGVPLSGLGLLLGLIGLLISITRKGSSIGFPVAGLIICAIALFVAISITQATSTAINEMTRSIEEQSSTYQDIVGETKPASDKPSQGIGESGIAAEQEKKPEWASVETPVKQGDIMVRIVTASVRKIPLEKDFMGNSQTSEEEHLLIEVEISNLSESKKYSYCTWAGADFALNRDFATIQDNFANTYKRTNFGLMTKPEGRTDNESIYPGKSIRDVLVFERPVDSTEYLNLELPGQNFGGEGMLRIRIPWDKHSQAMSVSNAGG